MEGHRNGSAYRLPVCAVGRKRDTNVFRPLSPDHPHDETWPGLLILRTEGSAFCANAQRVGEQMWPLIEAARPKVVVLDGSAVINIEYTALKLLAGAEDQLQASGTKLWLVGLNPHVLGMLRRSRLGRALGPDRLFANVETAVAAYLKTPRG